MTRFEFLACVAGSILFGVVLHFVLPAPHVPVSTAPEFEQMLLPNPAPTCPPYTDTSEYFEDGSMLCISGDGDRLSWSIDDGWRLVPASQ